MIIIRLVFISTSVFFSAHIFANNMIDNRKPLKDYMSQPVCVPSMVSVNVVIHCTGAKKGVSEALYCLPESAK